ncbi:luciferase family oxidoreductase, group 1 [Pseudonocardia oroxyli]|uniref:Luciferase family oxidoreductase, group 1 n=1 Tax=Pseudonocardia oroxyli TaxID=366584 RepID=A0A1G8C6A9_PSEOR|nr:luciferase family oxidoreductase, group 1 [Pseudonocardia oroxyli]
MVDGLLVPPPARFLGDLSLFGTFGRLLGFSADDTPPDYRAQVREVLSYFDGTSVHPDGRPLEVTPAQGADVEVLVLGASPGVSAQVAGELGLPFAANYHTSPSATLDAVAAYRAAFRPGRIAAPHVLVSADVVVADDDDRARELAAPYGQWVLDIRSGRGAHPYVTPQEAQARAWTEEERAAVRDRVDTQFVGSPATVTERLETLARATGADELVLTTITTEHTDRVRSYELLAKAWGA